MAETPIVIIDTITHRQGTLEQWEQSSRILQPSEIGYDLDEGLFKMGDGVHLWDELDYYWPSQKILEAIQEAVASIPGGGAALEEHIHSENPHPEYDDGSSFTQSYLNARA